MLDYEPTGVDPYEDDTDDDDMPYLLYAMLYVIAAVICFVTAPIAWLKR